MSLIGDILIVIYNKSEFGFDYVAEWHKDIVNLEWYYITHDKNKFFVAFDNKSDEIIATIGIKSYDNDFKEFKNTYLWIKQQVSRDYL